MAQTVIRYPENVAKFNKWLRFDVRSGRHVGRGQVVDESEVKDSVICAAALYLPTSALRSTMSVEWDTTEFSGMLMEMAAQATTTVAGTKVGQFWQDIGKARDQAAEALVNQWDAASLGQHAQNALEWGKKAVTGAAGAVLGTQVEALSGQKVNPRTDIIFSSQQYRAWTFEYILIPRTLKEAQNIEQILTMFRFYMLPAYQNAQGKQGPKASFMMGYPYEWTITLFGSNVTPEGSFGPFQTQTNTQGQQEPPPPGSTPLEHANKIGRSVLRNLSIDQAGGGKVAFVGANGSKELYPLVTSLTLEFQEVTLLGRDNRDMLGAQDTGKFPDPRAR